MNKLDYNNWVTKGLLIAFTMSLGVTLLMCHHESDDQRRIRGLEQQLAHGTIQMLHDTIRDTIPVVTQVVREVDKTDYKQQLADRQLIKDLKLELSKVVAENRMLRSTRDTVYMTREADSLFSYHDHWADFEVNTSSGRLGYCVRDSFDTFVDRIPKHRLLWWSWGTKGYRVKFVNYNPNVEIITNEMILINK